MRADKPATPNAAASLPLSTLAALLILASGAAAGPLPPPGIAVQTSTQAVVDARGSTGSGVDGRKLSKSGDGSSPLLLTDTAVVDIGGPGGNFASGTMTAFAKLGGLGVSGIMGSTATETGEQNQFDGSAKASLTDIVTLTSTDPTLTGKTVTWSGVLLLSGDLSASAHTAAPTGSTVSGGDAGASLFVTGSGGDGCPFGSGACADVSVSTVLPALDFLHDPVPEIGWHMDMVVGDPTSMTLSMLLTMDGKAFNLFTDAGSLAGEADFIDTLEWADGATFRDASGAVLDDVTLTSASGFDYAHSGVGGASGVPEPSAWALMIGGAALAGLAIRARRRSAASARTR